MQLQQINFDTMSPEDVKADSKGGVQFGCHVLSPSENPDRCVIDTDRPDSCNYGVFASGRVRKSKWTCPYWRPLNEAGIAN